jgi:hypothetical protein
MKIKALITTLVLGSSTVAMAQPVRFDAAANASWSSGPVRVGATWSTEPVVRDHRDRDYDHEVRPVRSQQRLLASNLRFEGTTKVIPVGHAAGDFRAIEITPRGPVNITKVGITYGRGQMLVVRDLDRTTRPGEPIVIDLPGNCQQIKDIAVYSDNVQNPGWRMRNAGTFTVSAL